MQINSAVNSGISANSVVMGLDVLMMTSAVAKKCVNLAGVKMNQVGNYTYRYTLYSVQCTVSVGLHGWRCETFS